jgi:septum site-determining protein MinC
VLGDVQEGGVVMADGDVVVLGRLHGDVHGGQNGDRGAVVYATQLDACHIRIADATAVVLNLQSPGCPVMASVQEDGTLR